MVIIGVMMTVLVVVGGATSGFAAGIVEVALGDDDVPFGRALMPLRMSSA